VFRAAGQIDDEREALTAALELYERKCNLVAADKLRRRVGELEQSTPLEV